MLARVAVALAVLALPSSLSAQPADPSSSLNDTQKLGQRLFYQHCVVCHTKPQITSGQYGPVLSKDTLGGQEDVMREFIGAGTARMPGFRFLLDQDQLGAIVAYLKTLPTPSAPAPNAPAPRAPSREAD
ncbi:MAG TPA: cytochrome c [Xanthobacteraceae bacterium]|nr:cytochrome c [Xanthobacteraceae bacterium]